MANEAEVAGDLRAVEAGAAATPDARTGPGLTPDSGRVVVEVARTGPPTAPVGEARPGGAATGRSATRFTLAEGRIVEQRRPACDEEA